MQQTTAPAPTWTLTCQGAALVLSDGRHREIWDIDRPWSARDMREVLHAATGNGLAAKRGPIAFIRETRTRPDGSLETRERYGAFAPSPSPSPSCDAPNCSCADGEDCHANGVGDPVQVVGMDTASESGPTSWTFRQVGDDLIIDDGLGNATIVKGAAKLIRPEDKLDTLAGKAGDAQQHEADRVMVRAVEPSYPGPADARGTWVLDPDATGHRAPFAVGDLVVRSSGRAGIHQVVAVSVDVDAPRHRSLRLTVEPTDVIVDADAI